MTRQDFPTFYVDDSTCVIAGRKHFILAAIAFDDETKTLSAWIQRKEEFGISAREEIHWKGSELSLEHKRSFIPIACSGTVIIILDDRSKQDASLALCRQAKRYCSEVGRAGYRLRFDMNIVSNKDQLSEQLFVGAPYCVGFSESDSRNEYCLQAADVVAGVTKFMIDWGLGIRDPSQKIELPASVLQGYALSEDEGATLGWALTLSLRSCIWGKETNRGIKPKQEPWKSTLGRGLVVHSSAPAADVRNATAWLSDIFMGCVL